MVSMTVTIVIKCATIQARIVIGTTNVSAQIFIMEFAAKAVVFFSDV